MTFSKLAAAAVALTLMAGGTSAVFAKAHDQGVADGDFPDVGTAEVVESIEGPGISLSQNGGQRGDTASTNGGDNRVEPVDQPGQAAR